ncbi:hypothetical protein [Mucilaginibacter oryzae]|uniref:hypothetical protein n=1 Tax=Mucilaginibacter oryzae TaxID=468058 RepID=UPI0014758DDC|nr:hypothetical protein [Mucilaginibacter oryzae]
MKNTNQQDINTPLVAEAKNWYESAYPTGNSKLSTMATTTDGPDYIQMFKPDWKHTATYARFNDDVIELPLDEATSTKLGIGLKSDEATDPVYDQAYSHSSFLMLKRNGKYRSFIMTIIADPAYLKNDLSKLNGNKYNKRDSDFTGVVLYATPKGKFINGWCYKNGKITEHIAPGKITDTTTTTGKRNTTQGIKTNTYSVTTCKTWLQISYVVGSSLPPTVTELETKCTTVNFDTGGGSGSGSGSSSGNGGAGGGSGTTIA